MKDTVQNPSIFAKVEPYVPDGIKVDDNNNLWTSSGSEHKYMMKIKIY